jgi:hypothetical protein
MYKKTTGGRKMRELKFRAWVLNAPGGAFMIEWDDILKSRETVGDGFEVEINFLNDPSYVWMQFTGLYDINNKEIYEGDIIKSEGRKLKVLWFDEGAQFIAQEMDDSGWDIMYSHGGRYEVVGNIYEM